ncbi:MAG: 7TM diverse intracellular signaling domain-containing protein, partial [Pseudomonadota bacterium]
MGARRLLLGATVLLLWLKVAAAGAADGPSPFLLDPAADFWTIDEAIERLADRPAFQPAPGDRFVQPLKPFTDRTVWFQIALPPTTRRVAILDGAMRAADLYFVAENRVLRRYRSGLLQPLATRADDHPGFNFTVPRSEQPMRLLVHSRMPYSSGPTPLLLLTEPEFVSYMRLKHMQHGMFFGIALLVALFTLAVALGMQRLEHLSFGAYCLGAAALTASFDGFLSYYLLPESPLLAMRALPIATLVMLVAQLQFGVQLLEVRSWNPGLHRASRLLLLPCIVLPLVTAIYPASLLYPLLSWIGVAVLLALGLMVLLGARAQAPFARLYALSLLPTALALGAVLTNTQTAGGFPSFAGAVILGTIGQIILLAGQRTRYLRESRNAEQANQDRQQELLAQLRTLTASTVDLTETQSLQRSLQQQQRLRTVGKIAAGVAHDFNNILTSISGFAELLQVDRGRFSVAKRDHFLAQIRAATERGASLVRQLNVYSRESRPRSAGRSIIEPIERTLRLLRSSVNPGIHFDTRIE